MNWGKTILAGVVGGVALWLLDFVLHGMVMAGTYQRYTEVFSQEPANPLSFLGVAIAIGITVAILFAKTRGSWAAGLAGGATFGLYLGIAWFFGNFYWPLVVAGFPYFLAWCWGGIGILEGVVLGGALGLILKS